MYGIDYDGFDGGDWERFGVYPSWDRDVALYVDTLGADDMRHYHSGVVGLARRALVVA